ncbi:MAG: hypothetical protein EXS08_04540 [Planctomycetes bacterium]|nr:hypothetical protein [Planctomycetota bacterium]
MKHSRILVAAFAVLFCACRTQEKKDASSGSGPALNLEPAQPPREWTRAFQKAAVLVADEIFIEGPSDLIDHVVLVADPDTNEYTTKTVTQGLLQELVAKPNSHVELGAQLDAWKLAAFRRITVLQRPGEVCVTVRASGEAYFAPADGSGEKRENQLVFQGLHGK